MKRLFFVGLFAIVLSALVAPLCLRAQTGADAWLRYAQLSNVDAQKYASLPDSVTILGSSPLLRTAQQEVLRGVRGMLGRTLTGVPTVSGPTIVIGSAEELSQTDPAFAATMPSEPDGFVLAWSRVRGVRCLVIAGRTDRGALYGVFALLRHIAQGGRIENLGDRESPSTPIRWVNQWDNLDGTIERGYGGRSIFYENRRIRSDLSRVSDYARILASVGINGCVVNNVNADPHMLDSDFIRQLARIADAFRPWGVQLGIAVDLSTPKVAGGLDTFDPLDPRVATWWRDKFDEVYRAIPDFGGVVMKADSEGRLGPSVYGRTPAEAANVIARALKPHGGVVFYRAFVYNHHLDWTNLKNDRAKAAYDNFHPLDGKFEDNVIIQIKNGPIDFQVREPASPLFGGLEKTNEAIELQVTQEYFGQQRHTVYLVPMWKEVLDFDLRVDGRHTPVKDMVAGRSFRRPTGGYVGVVNVGLDQNWLGNHLALANLYGYGRLAWNPELSAEAIIDEWTRMTFGNDPLVLQTVKAIQLASWPTYESYTGVLGLQTLTNITGAHYGPGPASQERNGWGQWIRAEHDAVGMDRSVATGTGFVGQYSTEVQKLYETAEATPGELILFFHHLPYTYKLSSGKSIIQAIYDAHYDGAERAQQFVTQWDTLRSHMDSTRFRQVHEQLSYQAGHAVVWRDAINDWFHRVSGIPDEKDRVGNHAGRVEAESMQLERYTPVDVTPWEGASGGRAIRCEAGMQSCSARIVFNRPKRTYELDVQYFDQNNGQASYRLFVNDRLVDQWKADMHLPSTEVNADTSTRRRVKALLLGRGDEIRLEGVPDGGDTAAVDYIEFRAEQ